MKIKWEYVPHNYLLIRYIPQSSFSCIKTSLNHCIILGVRNLDFAYSVAAAKSLQLYPTLWVLGKHLLNACMIIHWGKDGTAN